jgi:acetylglutamate kinase
MNVQSSISPAKGIPDEAKELLYVIKIGGNVIDNEEELRNFLEAFASIPQKRILVHGGGKIATAIGDKLGIISKYNQGRRITDDATIDLVTMVYGGLINKKIVASLQADHCNAIGVTGADANLVPAIKRPVKNIDYGWAGDIREELIHPKIWNLLLENQMTPVVAPLTHDKMGHILNTNADTIAAAIASGLAKSYIVKLIFCFEKNGVLVDVKNDNSAIAELTLKTYSELRTDNKLYEGILPKIDNAFDAVKKGVQMVVIGNSKHLPQLVDGREGTKIML